MRRKGRTKLEMSATERRLKGCAECVPMCEKSRMRSWGAQEILILPVASVPKSMSVGVVPCWTGIGGAGILHSSGELASTAAIGICKAINMEKKKKKKPTNCWPW